MRITPYILIIIGSLGLIFPHHFMAQPGTMGRALFAIIILLGCYSGWRAWQKSKNDGR